MFHISGVFTAAFDTHLEWLIVKGISDFANGEQVNAETKKGSEGVGMGIFPLSDFSPHSTAISAPGTC